MALLRGPESRWCEFQNQKQFSVARAKRLERLPMMGRQMDQKWERVSGQARDVGGDSNREGLGRTVGLEGKG